MDIALLAVLSFLVESSIEYVLGIWWTPGTPQARRNVLQAIALIVGVFIAFQARLDLPARWGLELGFMGELLTGVVIGRGAEFVHRIIKMAAKPGGE